MKSKEFRYSPIVRLVFLSAGGLCLLMSIACALMLVAAISGQLDSGGRIGRRSLTVVVVTLIPGLILIHAALMNFRMLVVVTKDGITFTNGRLRQASAWGEINIVRERQGDLFANDSEGGIMSLPYGGNHTFTLKRENGDPIVLNAQLSGLASLGKIIYEATYKQLFAKAKKKLLAEGTVTFGPLEIAVDKLTHLGKSPLDLADVHAVHRRSGKFIIETESFKGKRSIVAWQSYRISEIPNPHVAQALIEALSKKAKANRPHYSSFE